jgi:hypothetical protein
VLGWFEWTGGRIDEGIAALQRSASIYRSIGDLRGWGGAAVTLVWILARRAQFARATDLAEEIVRVGEGANDPQLTTWGSVCLGYLCTVVGPLGRSTHHLDKARSLSQRTSAVRMHANAAGVQAKCLLRQGRFVLARQILEEALAVLEARGMRDMLYIQPITAFTELCLIEAERSSGAARTTALRAAAAASAKAMKCSRSQAAGWRAEAMRLHGTVAWLRDQRALALERWRESVAIADAMQLPVDRARAWLEMGERSGDETLVTQARQVFTDIGAKVDLAFSLHASARMAAAAGSDVERALQAYALAQEHLDAVGAEYRFALACQERAAILMRCGHGDAARADLALAQRGFAAVGAPIPN